MNAPAPIERDEIFTLMGEIREDEFARRAKLRSYRNAATAMIAQTKSDTARYLAFEALDRITPWLYAPAPIEWLDRLAKLVSRLLRTAITAEELDQMLAEAAADACDRTALESGRGGRSNAPSR